MIAVLCGQLWRGEEFIGVYRADPDPAIHIPLTEQALGRYFGIEVRVCDPQGYSLIGVFVEFVGRPDETMMACFRDIWFLNSVQEADNALREQDECDLAVFLYDATSLEYRGVAYSNGVFVSAAYSDQPPFRPPIPLPGYLSQGQVDDFPEKDEPVDPMESSY